MFKKELFLQACKVIQKTWNALLEFLKSLNFKNFLWNTLMNSIIILIFVHISIKHSLYCFYLFTYGYLHVFLLNIIFIRTTYKAFKLLFNPWQVKMPCKCFFSFKSCKQKYSCSLGLDLSLWRSQNVNFFNMEL